MSLAIPRFGEELDGFPDVLVGSLLPFVASQRGAAVLRRRKSISRTPAGARQRLLDDRLPSFFSFGSLGNPMVMNGTGGFPIGWRPGP